MEKQCNPLLFKLIEWYGVHLHHRGQWLIHDKLQRIFNLNINKEFNIARAGVKWVLNPSDAVCRALFWLGTYDMWDMWHINRLVRKGSTIFDIGANFGYYSITIALGLRRFCSVYAFEPCPPTYERLVRHVTLNDLCECVKPFRVALSDKDLSSASISLRSDSSGAAYVILDGKGSVELITLDHFCSREDIKKIDFIKLDVEGFELAVLKGAKETIAHSKPIIFFELNPPCLKRNNVAVMDIVNLLATYGYSLHIAQRKKMVPFLQLPKGKDYVNIFAMPK